MNFRLSLILLDHFRKTIGINIRVLLALLTKPSVLNDKMQLVE